MGGAGHAVGQGHVYALRPVGIEVEGHVKTCRHGDVGDGEGIPTEIAPLEGRVGKLDIGEDLDFALDGFRVFEGQGAEPS